MGLSLLLAREQGNWCEEDKETLGKEVGTARRERGLRGVSVEAEGQRGPVRTVPSLQPPPTSAKAALVGDPGYGTRIYFLLYPALRLRLRAGLNSFAPAGLDFGPANSTGRH